MPLIKYRSFRFGGESRTIIDQANAIINEYVAKGFDLTLRQLYYQFVSRDLIPNTLQSYKRLGSIINDARLAGEIDWDRIEDRTRGVSRLSTWRSPEEIVAACAKQFRMDLWASQKYRIEVLIEKEALAGIFERICNELRVPYLSCRGYVSQSEMWRTAQRIENYIQQGQHPVILHFGDHDPSGIDMSRDIVDRVKMFIGGNDFEFTRLALNRDQIDTYNPPPNPAKTTDSRSASYISVHGNESWELDALDPDVLSQLVRDAVLAYRNEKAWNKAVEEEKRNCNRLAEVALRWDELTA